MSRQPTSNTHPSIHSSTVPSSTHRHILTHLHLRQYQIRNLSQISQITPIYRLGSQLHPPLRKRIRFSRYFDRIRSQGVGDDLLREGEHGEYTEADGGEDSEDWEPRDDPSATGDQFLFKCAGLIGMGCTRIGFECAG